MTKNEAKRIYLKNLNEKLEQANRASSPSKKLEYLNPSDLVDALIKGANEIIRVFGIPNSHSAYRAIQDAVNNASNYSGRMIPVYNALHYEVNVASNVSMATKVLTKIADIPLFGNIISELAGFAYLTRHGNAERLGTDYDRYMYSFIQGIHEHFEEIWDSI